MTETQSCIWLQCVFGAGSPLPGRIVSQYPSAAEFYDAGVMEWQISGLFTGAQIDKMESTSPKEAERILNLCDTSGYQVIGITNPRYPDCLRDLHAPPAVIYVDGTLPDFSRRIAIGMVGTREASPYGVQVAARLATELARQGVVIVSGGALGIDTASHRGAMMGGGYTVAVLGCGFHARYLMRNAELRRQIARTGALVSEYAPDTPVTQGSFPMRNRLIAALSRGTLVVEAGEKSGALITARQALELGRDVFAVPNNILSKNSAGVNGLLRDGAKAVAQARDILEEYTPVYGAYLNPEGNAAAAPEKTEPAEKPTGQTSAAGENAKHRAASKSGSGKRSAAAKKSEFSTKPESKVENPVPTPPETELELLSPEAQKLYRALTNQPQPADELGSKTGLQARQVLAAVTELEMMGMLRALPGKQYALN